jgi:hypothetical protein
MPTSSVVGVVPIINTIHLVMPENGVVMSVGMVETVLKISHVCFTK